MWVTCFGGGEGKSLEPKRRWDPERFERRVDVLKVEKAEETVCQVSVVEAWNSMVCMWENYEQLQSVYPGD